MTPVSLLFPRKLRRIVSFMTGGLAGFAIDAQEVAQSGETLRLIESRDLFISQAVLTGEALPVENERQILTLSVKADGGFYWNLGSEVDTDKQMDKAMTLPEMTSAVTKIIAAGRDHRRLAGLARRPGGAGSVLVRQRYACAYEEGPRAVPPTPADGWCIMIRACGSADDRRLRRRGCQGRRLLR